MEPTNDMRSNDEDHEAAGHCLAKLESRRAQGSDPCDSDSY